MKTPLDFNTSPDQLIIPKLSGFYNQFAQPLGWLLLRVALGGWLLIEGWPKILDPLGQVGFVENIGFHPGWLFSPLLAIVQVVGGIAILLGFYTRAFALANAVMLFTTVWYHLHFPYDAEPLLSPDGIAAIKETATLVTANGARRLVDGGAALLSTLQHKAVQLSSLWAFGCLFFAAFGGGLISLDRKLRKTF